MGQSLANDSCMSSLVWLRNSPYILVLSTMKGNSLNPDSPNSPTSSRDSSPTVPLLDKPKTNRNEHKRKEHGTT